MEGEVGGGQGSGYKLRATLLGHSMDVRGVASGTTGAGKQFIISGSRDRSAKIWMASDDDPASFSQFQSCEGHTNFVSCVAALPPCDKWPQGLILTGGHDHTILAFELGGTAPLFRLVGHKGTVCSIAGGAEAGIIISGSWDTSAKIWDGQKEVGTLNGHTAAVWAVAALPGVGAGSGAVLTASADKEIRLWVGLEARKVYKGHTDCVRALAVLDAEKFLSGSNDASIRLWSVADGETLQVFYGHTNFIYSIAMMPDNCGFVSVGEDRTLRIWRGSEAIQVLFHPATSVWSVATLANGDIVTGSSDGSLRVFSQDPGRWAPPELRAAFEEEVSKSVVAAASDLGGMKISSLPGPETLMAPGKSDGETKMVREGDKVGCYSWSAGDKKWTKVGDVVGASGATQGTSGKVLYEGKEYDYVFDVDLDDEGGKKCKLPYNVTEDPWFAAQKFIHKNGLSQLFLDQVANFIVNNTKGMTIGSSAPNNDFADPFTGGGRYIPGSAPATGFQASGSNGGGLDPFTGSGAYTTSSARPAASSGSATELNNSSSGSCFPVAEFLTFPTPPNYEGLGKKLVEFMAGAGPQFEGKLELLLDLGRKGQWSPEVEVLVKESLFKWPQEKIFPILDLIRLGVLKPDFASGLNSALAITSESFVTKFLSPGPPATNQMLTLRLLCNGFGPLTPQLMSSRHVILTQMLSQLQKGKMNEIAGSSLLLNYSIVAAGLLKNANESQYTHLELQNELLMSAVQLLDQVDEPEATFRLLVAIGNLLSGENGGELGALFVSLGGDALLKSHGDSAASLPKIKNCAQQLLAKVNK